MKKKTMLNRTRWVSQAWEHERSEEEKEERKRKRKKNKKRGGAREEKIGESMSAGGKGRSSDSD